MSETKQSVIEATEGGKLFLYLSEDGDVTVCINDPFRGDALRFCTAIGGGSKTNRTRKALIALMDAIDADNPAIPVVPSA